MSYNKIVTILTPERKGEVYAVAAALLWSLFPVVTILTFSALTPLFSAGISTLLSALFFAVLLTLKRQWVQLRERRAWRGIFFTSLYIGVLYYGLIFIALRYTTAGNEAIMSLMEVLFSFLILGVFLKHETLIVRHLLGAACMVVGALVVLLPKASGWHGGDLLVILATMFAPLGNTYAQEARKFVSSEFIMFCRSVLSGCALLLLGYVLEPLPTLHTVGLSLGFLMANGVLLLGLSKILWIESVHVIPITKAVSLECIYPFFTLMVAATVLGEKVGVFQIVGLIPIVIGVLLLTRKGKTT